MEPITSALDHLSTGRFGDANTIIKDSASNLVRLGVSPALADTLDIHPALDYEICRRNMASDTSWTPLGEQPQIPLDGPAGPERWFTRDHPADEGLRDLLQQLFRSDTSDGEVVPSVDDPDPRLRRRVIDADALLQRTLPGLWESIRIFTNRVYTTNS